MRTVIIGKSPNWKDHVNPIFEWYWYAIAIIDKLFDKLIYRSMAYTQQGNCLNLLRFDWFACRFRAKLNTKDLHFSAVSTHTHKHKKSNYTDYICVCVSPARCNRRRKTISVLWLEDTKRIYIGSLLLLCGFCCSFPNACFMMWKVSSAKNKMNGMRKKYVQRSVNVYKHM